MRSILYKLPHSLLYSRLVVAFLLILFSFIHMSSTIIIALTVYAIISDIFDGMLARRLKISTVEMRQMDTKIDTVFWFSCLFYLCIHQTSFLKTHVVQLLILVSSEFIIILFGLLKFNERISHYSFKILGACFAVVFY